MNLVNSLPLLFLSLSHFITSTQQWLSTSFIFSSIFDSCFLLIFANTLWFMPQIFSETRQKYIITTKKVSSQNSQRTWLISGTQPKSIIMQKLCTVPVILVYCFHFVFGFTFLLTLPIKHKVKGFLREYISIHYSKHVERLLYARIKRITLRLTKKNCIIMSFFSIPSSSFPKRTENIWEKRKQYKNKDPSYSLHILSIFTNLPEKLSNSRGKTSMLRI